MMGISYERSWAPRTFPGRYTCSRSPNSWNRVMELENIHLKGGLQVIWSHPFIHRWQTKQGQAPGEANQTIWEHFFSRPCKCGPALAPALKRRHSFTGVPTNSQGPTVPCKNPGHLYPNFLGFVIHGLWRAWKMEKKIERSLESHPDFWLVLLKRQL